MLTFTTYEEWYARAESLGWVHVDDELVVVDDPETGIVLGEWDDAMNKGWILGINS